MPKIKIEKILSVSSEDKVYVAENILNIDSKKTWKCKNAGEQNCSIILQLAELTKINAIDIGNEHSAFVEVFVGRTGFDDKDYKVFLMMSSFMTPLESRQSENIHRTRMFKTTDFCKDVCDERWDRVKFVCTQPFNRHVQYGLSFVVLHSPENEQKENSTPTESVSKLGKFLIRPESAVEDDISRGSFFNKLKNTDNTSTPVKTSVAAAIRKASLPTSLAKTGSPTVNIHKINASKATSPPSSQNGATKRDYKYLLYDSDDEKPNEKIDRVIEKHKKENDAASNKEVIQPNSTSRKNTKRKSSPEPSTSKEQPTKKLRPLKTKPFGKLMEDVVFAMSGYQNPLRSDLRNMALEMGAKYKPDWSPACTHLVCAFKNTPKYNEVRGRGKIITCDWILECHSKRKRLPWRRFALDSKDQNQTESEEEIVDEDSVLLDSEELECSQVIEKRYNISSDSDDTEDEIERVQASTSNKQNENETKTTLPEENSDDVYNKDTDIEDEKIVENVEDEQFKILPKLFSDLTFFIDENLSDSIKAKLERYIFAYGGSITGNINEAQYILAEDNTIISNLEMSIEAKLVHPAWIWECHDSELLIPVDKFVIDK